jgi:transposase-like protein
MARAYSLDLRERVVGAVAAGQSCRAVASTFGVSVASVVKWSQRFRSTGSAAAFKVGGRRPFALAGERSWLLARIADSPQAVRVVRPFDGAFFSPMVIGASLLALVMLLSATLTQAKQWEAGVEFVCGHCGANSLRLIGVSEKVVRVDCLSCGKESTVERGAGSTSPAKPSAKPLAKSP